MLKKNPTNNLTEMMRKGFRDISGRFDKTDTRLNKTDKKTDDILGILKLTRLEMAKNEDIQEIKATTDNIYQMLDDEARFIQKMQSEYPILIKRLERIEKQLGLPPSIMENS